MPSSDEMWLNMAASSSCAAVAVSLFNPLDCLRVRWQVTATAVTSASASALEPSVVSVRLGAFHAYNQAFGRKSDLGITVKATFTAPAAPGAGLCVTLITPHGQVHDCVRVSCACGGECGGVCACE